MKTLAGHGRPHRLARVSTADQNPALQDDALRAAGCVKVFTDRASGRLDKRPELSACLSQLRRGDTLTVWRLDRLGRSVRHLIDVVTDLDAQGVGFRSLTEQIDTTTAGGRLVFHVFAGLAEFERSIISERTQAGLAAARARGRHGGRRPKLSAAQASTARKLYEAKEHTAAEIAAMFGCSRATLYRALKATV